MSFKYVLRWAAVLAFALALCTSSSAAWEVINLHPAGASGSSYAYGNCGGFQVGSVEVDGVSHASLWVGSAGSWVDINPTGSTESAAYGVSGGQQVGYTTSGGNAHAALWSGTADSWTNLDPVFTSSVALGVADGKQFGSVVDGSYTLAVEWTGPGVFEDLTPSPGESYCITGLSGGQRVGVRHYLDSDSAFLWNISPGNIETSELHPAGCSDSQALGVADGQQVGYATFGGIDHAGLWSGTTASWVDLSPVGSSGSQARGVSHGKQVGYAHFGISDHAGLWSGTAASFVDLHSFLAANYMSSVARSIEVTGNDTWVAGYATNSTTGYQEAVLWHNVVPEPSGILALGSGLLALRGLIRRRKK